MQRVCGCKLEDGCDWSYIGNMRAAWKCKNISEGLSEQDRRGREMFHSFIAQCYINHENAFGDQKMQDYWLNEIEKTKEMLSRF